MDNSFKNLIDSASSILILLPASPLLDEVSSGLVLEASLKNQKQTSISCPTMMTVEFSRLIGVDKVATQLGNKNLIITFPGYPANDIERVSYDIEDGQFKLSVIPKTGLSAPTKQQVVANYEGISADTAILVGGDKETDFPALNSPELKNAKIIHLGTKLLESSNTAQILSFAQPGSSVSELVAKTLKDLEINLDPDMATNLLAGIEDGSKNFQGTQVSATTFEIFAELLNMGGLRLKKIQPSDFPQGSIPQKPYNQPQQSQQQVDAQPAQVSHDVVQTQDPQEIPQTWTEPKVYTGTSVS